MVVSIIFFKSQVDVYKVFALTDSSSSEIKGNLVIVGGGLEASNADIYKEFIRLAGGNKKAMIGIIPAASATLRSSKEFKTNLTKFGVLGEQVNIISLSSTDDPETPVKESEWKSNTDADNIAQEIKKLTGIWFVGGDQSRIVQTLLKPDGNSTLALQAIWEIYKKGAVIGGTSAGAAIMSEIMITGGESLGAINKALEEEECSDEKQQSLCVQQGLGFFHYGIIDQHFNTRKRLGRLVIAAYEQGDRIEPSFGIDENTALIVNNEKKIVNILGENGVTIIDVSRALKKASTEDGKLQDIRISYILKGDSLNLNTGKIIIDSNRTVISSNQANIRPWPRIINPSGNLGIFQDSVIHNFICNGRMKSIESYCFREKVRGPKVIFRKIKESQSFKGYGKSSSIQCSFKNIAVDIIIEK